MILRQLNIKGEAKDNIEEAIELEPTNAHLFRVRGTWQKEDNMYAGALADFSRAIELEPDAAIHYFCKSLVHKEMKVSDSLVN